MVVSPQEEVEGDNLEFNVAVAADIICEVNLSGNTSADDTTTTKHTNSAHRRKTFDLRADQAVQIIKINNGTLTNPYTCTKNGVIQERFDSPFLFKMTIRVLTDNTNIKWRVR